MEPGPVTDRVPATDHVPVTIGLFEEEAGGAARLIGGECRSCGRRHFPLLTTCPYCSAESIIQVRLSPEGTLWAWTAVTAPPPGYRGEVPYGFGVVELVDDGIRVVTRLTEGDPSRLALGQAMRLVVAPLHEDDEGRTVVTYAFAPAGGAP